MNAARVSSEAVLAMRRIAAFIANMITAGGCASAGLAEAGALVPPTPVGGAPPGMRAGEMSALKWSTIDFDRRIIKVVETRVEGEEGRPKTQSSYRDIIMLPMVYDALKKQELKTRLRSKYVFLNPENKPIEIETLRKNAWSKGLQNAGIEYRPIIQTRHTFATMMISAGENLGWVQKMMGHSSLKMITDKYFSYIPNMTHQDGTKFLEEYEKKVEKEVVVGK